MATSDTSSPIEWGNWKYGDWGSFGPEQTGRHYHAVNCQVYENGTIGPRPGWTFWGELSTPILPTALLWRSPGNRTEYLSQTRNRWLHLEGRKITGAGNSESLSDDPYVSIVPIHPFHLVGGKDRHFTISPTEAVVPYPDDSPVFPSVPEWWESSSGTDARPMPSWVHTASVGDGALVTVNGRVYTQVFDGYTPAGPDGLPSQLGTLTAHTGVRPAISVTADPTSTPKDALVLDDYPTIAEPYGVRMFYTGVEEGETDVWFSNPNNFSNLERTDVLQNRFGTTIADSYSSGIIMLKEVPDGLLVGTVDGKMYTLRGATPQDGTFRLLETVGAPSHPGGYVLVAGQVFYVPPDGRGVVITNADGVDSTTFQHLRFLEQGRSMQRGGVVGRAIGDNYNQYLMFVSERNNHLPAVFASSQRTAPFTTLEFCNGVWLPGEVVNARQVDYARVPGGRLARVITETNFTDGSKTRLYLRDQVLNAPVTRNKSWSVPLRKEYAWRSRGDGYIGMLAETPLNVAAVPEADQGYGIVVLPEFRLVGAPELQIEGIVIELEYWKDSRISVQNGTRFTWSPELYTSVRVIAAQHTDVKDAQPIYDLFGLTWGADNLLKSPWVRATDGLPPWIAERPRNTAQWELPEGEQIRWYVLIPGTDDIPLGSGFQLALKFRDLAIRRIIPRVNIQQWHQYVDTKVALGEAQQWGR